MMKLFFETFARLTRRLRLVPATKPCKRITFVGKPTIKLETGMRGEKRTGLFLIAVYSGTSSIISVVWQYFFVERAVLHMQR